MNDRNEKTIMPEDLIRKINVFLEQFDELKERIDKLEEQKIEEREQKNNYRRKIFNEDDLVRYIESVDDTDSTYERKRLFTLIADSSKLSEDGTAYKLIQKVLKMRQIDFSDYKIHSNVKAIMKEKKYTQDELANLINVNRSTIVNILNGKGVSLENAFKLSSILETPIEGLFEYVLEGEIDE